MLCVPLWSVNTVVFRHVLAKYLHTLVTEKLMLCWELRTCARASVRTDACASTCARTVPIHALACVVQLVSLIQAGLPRLHSALVGQTRRAARVHQSSSGRGEAVWDSFSVRPGDAHRDRRVSRGRLRVEALYGSSPCPPAAAEEIIWGQFGFLFFFFLKTEWLAQSAFWKHRGKRAPSVRGVTMSSICAHSTILHSLYSYLCCPSVIFSGRFHLIVCLLQMVLL